MLRRALTIFVLCITSGVLAFGDFPELGENILINGSFEEVTPDGLPTGWNAPSPKTQVRCNRLRTANEGACFLHFGATGDVQRVSQTIEVNVDPSQYVAFRVNFRRAGDLSNQTIGLRLIFNHADGSRQVESIGFDNEPLINTFWGGMGLSYYPTEPTTSVKVIIYARLSSGGMAFDNAELRVSEPPD